MAHRVGEILESTTVRNWHWVPTSLNVADDATRGISMRMTLELALVGGVQVQSFFVVQHQNGLQSNSLRMTLLTPQN